MESPWLLRKNDSWFKAIFFVEISVYVGEKLAKTMKRRTLCLLFVAFCAICSAVSMQPQHHIWLQLVGNKANIRWSIGIAVDRWLATVSFCVLPIVRQCMKWSRKSRNLEIKIWRAPMTMTIVHKNSKLFEDLKHRLNELWLILDDNTHTQIQIRGDTWDNLYQMILICIII